jgi:hypothetical protein
MLAVDVNVLTLKGQRSLASVDDRGDAAIPSALAEPDV